jgi:cohesin loading factor subunit SCC2
LIALKNQVCLVIRTVQRGESVLAVLESLLQSLLSSKSKNAAANFQVCKAMVAMMFEGVVDNEELPQRPSQPAILQTLTVFAKANVNLFVSEQVELLQPYVENLSNTDDLMVYRSVIVIFRYVFPYMTSLQHSFLQKVQQALLNSVPKLGKNELNEVSMCLWTIDGVLKNTDKLVRLTSQEIYDHSWLLWKVLRFPSPKRLLQSEISLVEWAIRR